MFSNIDWSRIPELLTYNPREPLIFNSGLFLFLFLFFLVFHQLVSRKQPLRILYITVFSLFFYYKSSGAHFIFLVLVAAAIHILAHAIHRSGSPGWKKFYLLLGVAANLAFLGYFKYANFLISTANSLTKTEIQPWDVFLLPGISFYIFQSLSYLIDVYRGEFVPMKSFVNLCFCVSFFPHLVAGPIIRASYIIPQLEQEYYVSRTDMGRALYLILAGLIKKAVIADYISLNFVDRIFDEPLRYTGVENLMGAYAYTLQIYCDFSGYSDMAIGISLLLGFRLPVNFNAPFVSASITEFWRRWHISLSSWLKDYLYIPLGGSRKGRLRQYFNLVATMLLGGLWHGAAWKFVLWGGLHGVVLAIEKALHIPELVSRNRVARAVGFLATFHIVCLGWIFFRADSAGKAVEMLSQIFLHFDGEVLGQLLSGYPSVFALMAAGYVAHFVPARVKNRAEDMVGEMPLFGKAAVIVAVIVLVMQVKSADIQPFIYFQF